VDGQHRETGEEVFCGDLRSSSSSKIPGTSGGWGTADVRANGMMDCFDFGKPARPFAEIPLPLDTDD
jgi:hypothetical protein